MCLGVCVCVCMIVGATIIWIEDRASQRKRPEQSNLESDLKILFLSILGI